MKTKILNTSMVTSYGVYNYYPITLEKAREIAHAKCGFESAIGHEASAQIISELLGIDCPVNRINYVQQPQHIALVFKLKGRPPEGKILSREEIEKIGYTWGILERKA